MHNNSVSPVSLVCNPSYNVISPIDLSNNFLDLNDHGIPFLWLFRDGELVERSIGLVTLWLGSHTSDTGLAELLYISTEAGPGVSTVD